uniref:Putative secreted peptide n=1 Tax=Anopheles braziliensis TaxID=58242 RepID=A0A2M3ZS08_9DIPT
MIAIKLFVSLASLMLPPVCCSAILPVRGFTTYIPWIDSSVSRNSSAGLTTDSPLPPGTRLRFDSGVLLSSIRLPATGSAGCCCCCSCCCCSWR